MLRMELSDEQPTAWYHCPQCRYGLSHRSPAVRDDRQHRRVSLLRRTLVFDEFDVFQLEASRLGIVRNLLPREGMPHTTRCLLLQVTLIVLAFCHYQTPCHPRPTRLRVTDNLAAKATVCAVASTGAWILLVLEPP